MSFLNPVSHKVSRYGSRDMDAPQINFASRKAGDIKTILKACLVTGYGAKDGAGWQMMDETDYTAVFVSPNVAMADYQLVIDDTASTTTKWGYVYRDEAERSFNVVKRFINQNTDNTHADNRWELLVTEQGFIFIELVYRNNTGLCPRITLYSQIKSAITTTEGRNIFMMNAGFNGVINSAVLLGMNLSTSNTFVQLDNNLNAIKPSTLYGAIYPNAKTSGSLIELSSPVFLTNNDGIVGQLAMLVVSHGANDAKKWQAYDEVYEGRAVLTLSVPLYNYNVGDYEYRYLKLRIYLDHWEY